MRFSIDPDIRRASTLPASFYLDPELYRAQTERVLARSYHVAAFEDVVPEPGTAAPLTLLPGSLDEPILFTRDEAGAVHALSNVCTHRANLVTDSACRARSLRCRYHGRRFDLTGRFVSMPEFEAAADFPRPSDDLPKIAHASWGPLWFAALSPSMSFEAWSAPFAERLAFVPWSELQLEGAPRHYDVAAHWALYCDNYLEGLHVPFVHAGLNEALDYGAYETLLGRWSSLQIGIAKRAEDAIRLPADHPDQGRAIAGYYLFLFPGTMVNVYPWGVSLNAVRPLGIDRTRVTYASYVVDASRRAAGAGADLHSVELEDEAVVESVQRGIRSRLYPGGRFSPTRERGVHHFHRLLAELMSS